MDEDRLMMRCVELARTAADAGDAAVGSLIVHNGIVIAEGTESVKRKNDPTAHAEIEAVREACRKIQSLDLSGAVLFTNVEPCIMCSFAIRQTGIALVVYSRSNLDVGGANSKFDVLTDATFRLKYGPPQIRTVTPVERAPGPCIGMD